VKQDEIQTVVDFFKFVKPDKVAWAFNITDNLNRNLLHIAAYEGSVKVMRHMLKFTKLIRLNIDTLDSNGDTPLLLATIAESENDNYPERKEIVEMLIKAGASLGVYLKRKTNNPLHWACYHGDKEVVRLLNKTCEEESTLGSLCLMTHLNQKGMFPFDYLIPDFMEKIEEKEKRWEKRKEIGKMLVEDFTENMMGMCDIGDFFSKKTTRIDANKVLPDTQREQKPEPVIDSALAKGESKKDAIEVEIKKKEPSTAQKEGELVINDASPQQPEQVVQGGGQAIELPPAAAETAPMKPKVKEKVYEIAHHQDTLDPVSELEHHMLLFSALTGDNDAVEVLIQRGRSPFRRSYRLQ
jgi:hypothetical protein